MADTNLVGGYLNSSLVQVFPSSRRDDTFDRNARLNTEQNLISIVNRLNSVDSFVIDGLNLSANKDGSISITAGSCNIHGYYFKLKALENIVVKGLDSTGAERGVLANDELCFIIKLDTTPIGNEITFNELKGTDNNGIYEGLTLAALRSEDKTADGCYYLPIAKYTGTTWEQLPNTTLKYFARDMSITVPNAMVEDGGLVGTQTFSLQDWANSFIIDDGELEV